MADVTLNGSAVLKGRLLLKRRGNWLAYLDELDMDAAPSGEVTLRWLGTECKGYVLRSGLADGVVSAQVIGGRGGGGKLLPAKMYDYQFPLSMVLDDILRDAGEALSAAADQAVLTRSMARYVRLAGDLGHQLDQLADRVGAVWRFLPDGSVWFGVDAWPAAPAFEHELRAEWTPATNIVPIAPEALGVLPGQRYTGPAKRPDLAMDVRVATAAYSITPDSSLAELYALGTQAPGGESALSQALRDIVDEQTQKRDWDRVYTGRVIQQRGDGTLDLEMADKRLPELTSVQVRGPVARGRITVPAGAIANVIFEDGDLERAVAVGYQLAGATDQTKPTAREGDSVSVDLWFITAPVGQSGATVVIGISPTAPPAPTPPAQAFKVTLTAGRITSGFAGFQLPEG